MSLNVSALRTGATVAAWVLAFTVFAPAPAAQAHPFGPPQTATIEATGGDSLRVQWRFGGTDDISYLAVALDILSNDRVTLDGAVFYEDGDDAIVAKAAAFHDYVLQHIEVENLGESCAGVVEPLSDLAADGATVNYTCAGPLGNTVVTIDMLNDLHPAYRTLVTGPAGQRAVYDGENTVHEWVLGSASGEIDPQTPAGSVTSPPTATSTATAPAAASTVSDPVTNVAVAATSGLGRSAAVQVAVVVGAIALLAAGLWWLRTRKRRM